MSESLVAPELVWGLFPRFVGFLYIIAFGGLARQLVPMVGERGLGPIAQRLRAARRDFPGLRRFHIFPTLLWLSSSDRTLRIVPLLGMLFGALCVYGGPVAPYAHFGAWLLWLSLEPATLIFPWDTMLMEAGFLAMFLPTVQPLPHLSVSTLPYPSVSFIIRFLVLRLMLGFGKVKFVGSTRQDTLYLRGFFAWSSTTPVAWFGHHLPAPILRGMLGFMFVGELIAPVLGFFSGPLRVVSLALLVMLMVGIQLTGNWGFFNLGYIMMCVCLLDTQSSIFDLGREPWHSTLWEMPQLGLNLFMGFLFLMGLLYLIASDSWTMRTLLHWPLDRYTWNRRWLRGLLGFLRAVAPLRIVNGYGVFPPGALPPMLEMPVFEGSHDGITWHAYRYKHAPSSASERPRFVAPYHPRIDMATGYSSTCVFDASFYGSLAGDGTPYAAYTRSSWLERMCQRLLEGDPQILGILGHNPFPDAPPKLMRVSTMAMTPSNPAVRRETGHYWHTQRLGVIIAPHGKADWPDALSVPEAEVFHPDWVGYKRHAAPLKAMVKAYQQGLTPNRAVLVESDLTEHDVRSFWEDFLPCANEGRGDFSRHNEKAEELTARFGKLQLARFERVLERFAWLLRQHTERHQFADALPNLPITSNFRYHLFLQELVMDGQAAYEGYLGSVERVVQRYESSSDALQLWGLTMLRHNLMLVHIAAFRWTLIGSDLYKAQIPGLFEYHPLLSQYAPPGEEFRPAITKLPNGEHSIPGFYPAPGPVLVGAAEPAE